MRKAIALIALVSILLALCGCAGSAEAGRPEKPSAATTAEKTPLQPYEGEIPADLFGIYDEETYTNAAFGVKFHRNGSWSFYTQQKLASLNGGSEEASETLKRTGFVYDMYASSAFETLGFALAIPSSQFGKAMTEDEYAQAVKAASARDYAGADYDVVSDEIATARFGGVEHACFYLTVAASGMVFYTAQIFLQHGDFIGVIYVSASSEESMASLLSSFVGA